MSRGQCQPLACICRINGPSNRRSTLPSAACLDLTHSIFCLWHMAPWMSPPMHAKEPASLSPACRVCSLPCMCADPGPSSHFARVVVPVPCTPLNSGSCCECALGSQSPTWLSCVQNPLTECAYVKTSRALGRRVFHLLCTQASYIRSPH